MLKLETIRHQAIAVVVAIFLVMGLQLAGGIGLNYAVRQDSNALIATLEKSDSVALSLQALVGEIRLDVVEVQQFLTDISATRGLDGLDDGEEEAARNAAEFHEHLNAARTLAASEGGDDLAAALTGVENNFSPYYDQGQKMARLYVSEGPAGGNKLMGEFDSAAEALDQSLIAAADKLAVFTRQQEEIKQASVARLDRLETIGIAVLLVLGLVGLVIGGIIYRALSRASVTLSDAAEVAQKTANGDLNARIIGINRQDEIGALLRNINRTLDLTEAFTKESDAAMRSANARKYFRKILPRGLRGNFATYAGTINDSLELMKQRDDEFAAFVNEKVKAVAVTVAGAATQLSSNATTMTHQAQATSEQSEAAANAANEASGNVQAVAAAVEEFNASINEIAQQMSKVATYADEAVTSGSRADRITQTMTAAADKIGDVVQLISEIANQTNLLALNATIEAARAGEAGKGFAVVASEVKSLATQTAKATEEITQQISAMQGVVSEVNGAISDINGKVKVIGEASAAVASAVEEQRAVTQEISGNISSVSAATGAVSQAVGSVSQTARQSSGVTHEVSAAAGELSQQAERLRTQIDDFLTRLAS